MRFRFLSLLAISMIAGLLVLSSEAHATGEDTGWSRITTHGASAFFTIEHRTDLVTEGTVQASKRLRWERNTAGVEIIDTVNLQGWLLLCEGEDCRTVWTWTVKANKDVTAENLLHISSDSARLEATFPVTVKVLDFSDADGDGNRDEVVASFTTDVSITASWTWVEKSTNLCGENGQAAGDAISVKTSQPASFSGNLAGQKLTPVSATASQSETVYSKDPMGSCA